MGERSLRAEAVAVTGIGIVSALGFGREQFWTALVEGRSGIAPIESLPPANGPPTVAAEVRGFVAREYITSSHLRRMDRFSRMIVAAARMALLDDARGVLDGVPLERVGVVVGSALGEIADSVTHLGKVFTKGAAAASPMVFPNLVLNAAASYAAMELGATGINLTAAQNEISGEQAIIVGCDAIRAGRADVVIAGGGDELAAIVVDVHRRIGALSGQHGGSEWSSPYDAQRNGVVLGEGAAMLVLESVARSRSRGATVYAEIAGDLIFSVPAPSYDWPPHATAAVQPLRRLIGDQPLDLICGGANSTRRLDACELDLHARLLGERATAAQLTSIKGAIGEFGAAGATTVAAACLALHEQVVPPLCHLRQPEPGSPLRFAGRQGAPFAMERALVCGLARGGAGAALLLRRATA
ncbi:MAG: hypothetical protein HYR72_21155 [Deltaproteobacteria bacterium]|nr:hypothetical protein [Deltaproteobacteria bacterium]MBI3386617.1 hypothetical protein [Deltaproteobacteria bacterium]